MTHPDIELGAALPVDMVLDILEQAGRLGQRDPCISEFLEGRRHHASTELGRHGMQAVTDTEHRHIQFEHDRGRLRPVLGVNGLGTAGKDDAPGCELQNVTGMAVPGHDLAVHADFPDTPGDQLGVLGSEIQDQDPVGMNVVCRHIRILRFTLMSCTDAGQDNL